MKAKDLAACLLWLSKNASRQLTEEEKQLAHKAIDNTGSVKELLLEAMKIAKIS